MAVFGVAAALALAGCGAAPRSDTAEVVLGSGMLGGSSWSVTAYRSVEYGRCLRLHFSAGDPGAVCEGSAGSLGTSTQDDPAGAGTVVVIDATNEGWTDGVVSFDDGSTLPVIVGATGFGRFLVFAVPAPRTAEVIDLRNAVSGRTERQHLR